MASKSKHTSDMTQLKRANRTYLPVEALLYPKVTPKPDNKKTTKKGDTEVLNSIDGLRGYGKAGR